MKKTILMISTTKFNPEQNPIRPSPKHERPPYLQYLIFTFKFHDVSCSAIGLFTSAGYLIALKSVRIRFFLSFLNSPFKFCY